MDIASGQTLKNGKDGAVDAVISEIKLRSFRK